MTDAVLALHIAAGGLGLLSGGVAGLARKTRGVHTAAGWTYQGAVAVLSATTLVLVAVDPGLWPFLLIVVPTQAAAAAAVVVRRRGRRGWVPVHVQLVLGSYVSFVTAFAVNTVGGLLSWLVPSLVGTVVVATAASRAALVRPSAPAGRPPASQAPSAVTPTAAPAPL